MSAQIVEPFDSITIFCHRQPTTAPMSMSVMIHNDGGDMARIRPLLSHMDASSSKRNHEVIFCIRWDYNVLPPVVDHEEVDRNIETVVVRNWRCQNCHVAFVTEVAVSRRYSQSAHKIHFIPS